MTSGWYLDPDNATVDELLPRSRGGKMTIDNQVPAHARCNMRRGNMVAPQAAFDRHHAELRKHGKLPTGNESGMNTLSPRHTKEFTAMPDFKQTNAQDNPPEKQKERTDAAKPANATAYSGAGETPRNTPYPEQQPYTPPQGNPAPSGTYAPPKPAAPVQPSSSSADKG